jgi:hypothetical protein
MSLSETVSKTLDNAIHKFIENIANKYNLDVKQLLHEWEYGTHSALTKEEAGDKELDPVYLLKCLKPELIALCKAKGVRSTGTKAELITALQSNKMVDNKKSSPTSFNNTKISSIVLPDVLKKLKTNIPTIAIRKNQFGNHEDPNTSFVFDRKTKKVIGKQNDDGTIQDLSKEDINICNKNKYEYVLPFNLDKQSKLDDEKVDELDEEDEEELDDENVLEEELFDDADEELEDELEEEEYEEEYVYEE